MPRFMRKGTTKIYFVPTIASLAAATVAEITAGENITGQVAEVNGFSFSNSPISTPDMDSRFTSQVSGEDTAEASNLTMYELDDPTDVIRDALPKGADGYIVFFYKGLAGATPGAGDDYEVFPVEVASNVRLYTAGNEAAQYRVNFTMLQPPQEGTVTS